MRLALYMSSPPWKPARATNPGTTRPAARPSCARINASACTTTSISSTRRSACATCTYPPGRRSGCSSTAMATARWRARSSVRASSSCRKTTPSCASPTWRAQSLADSFNPEKLHHRLTRYVHWLCPVADVFAQDDWHWSIRQAEYSTDLMFRSREILVPLYDAISRQGRAQRRCATCSGLPGQEDHSCSGARGRLAAVHAHRGPLHQSLHSSSRHELLKTGRPANLCY